MAVKLPVHAVASRSLRPKLGGRAGDYFVGTFEFCYDDWPFRAAKSSGFPKHICTRLGVFPGADSGYPQFRA